MSGTKSFSPDQVQLFVGAAPDDLAGTMTVLMKTNKYYIDGTLKQAKTSYQVTREWGRTAVEAGWAEDTDNVLPVQASTKAINPSQTLVAGSGAEYAGSSGVELIPRSLAANIGVGTDYIIKRFDTLAGSTVTGTATTSISSEVNSTPMLKVVTAAGTQTEVEVTGLNLTAPIGGDFVVQVYMQDVFACGSLRTLVSKNNYTGWADLNIALTGGSPAFREKDGWQVYTISSGSKSNGGTGFDFAVDTVDRMKIRVTPPAGKVATFFVHSFRLRAKAAPRFVVGFDDGRDGIFLKKFTGSLGGVSSTYSIRDILAYYDIKPTLWIVTGVIGQPGHLTWDQVRQLYAEGWDIQAQIDTNVRSTASRGASLLGPHGYSVRAIASVDTAADTITCSAVHDFPTFTASDVSGAAIEFVGTDLPAPLTVGVGYWARLTTTTAFKVYLTEYDSLIDANAIDLTTTGTAANFGWRWVGSRPDHTGILENLQRHLNIIERQVGIRPRHVAPNQGCADKYVNRAYDLAGMKYIRSVADTTSHRYWTQLPSEELGPCWPRGAAMVVQTDNGALTQANVQTAVDNVITDGAVGWSYHHDLDTPTGLVLIHLCDYLAAKRAAGQISVVQARDL